MFEDVDVRLTRRAALAGAVAAIALARSPVAAAESFFRGQQPWPLPAHDLLGTRSSAVALGVRGTVGQRWQVELAGGVTGAPLVALDRVLAASFGGQVGAFDLATGEQLWLQSLGTVTYAGDRELGFFGGLALCGDRIVVASDHAQCIDARTGETVWQAPPLAPPGSDDYFWAPPAIVDGIVLLGSGSGSESLPTVGRLSAYSLADGSLLWSTPMVPSGGNGGGIVGQPTVDLPRRRVYVATGAPYVPQAGTELGTDSVVELTLDDGEIVWADQVHVGDQLGLDLNSSPVLADNLVVVVAGKDGFRAWERSSHTLLWHVQVTPATPAPGTPANPTSGPEGGPIAFDGRSLYGLSNDSTAGTCVAVAIEPRTGTVLWQTALPAFSFAPPAVAADAVAVPGSDGTLRLLAPVDGVLLAELPLAQPSSGAPSVTNGTVLVGTGAGPFLPGNSLICFGRTTTSGG